MMTFCDIYNIKLALKVNLVTLYTKWTYLVYILEIILFFDCEIQNSRLPVVFLVVFQALGDTTKPLKKYKCLFDGQCQLCLFV